MSQDEKWIPATDDFIAADVVRWTEPVWSDKKRGRGKNAKHVMLAKQQIVGQIEEIDGDYVAIKVISAEIIVEGEKKTYRPLLPREIGSVVRKKPATLAKNGIERRPWSDETARNAIVSEGGL